MIGRVEAGPVFWHGVHVFTITEPLVPAQTIMAGTFVWPDGQAMLLIDFLMPPILTRFGTHPEEFTREA